VTKHLEESNWQTGQSAAQDSVVAPKVASGFYSFENKATSVRSFHRKPQKWLHPIAL